jgi:hypothetical protein
MVMIYKDKLAYTVEDSVVEALLEKGFSKSWEVFPKQISMLSAEQVEALLQVEEEQEVIEVEEEEEEAPVKKSSRKKYGQTKES